MDIVVVVLATLGGLAILKAVRCVTVDAYFQLCKPEEYIDKLVSRADVEAALRVMRGQASWNIKEVPPGMERDVAAKLMNRRAIIERSEVKIEEIHAAQRAQLAGILQQLEQSIDELHHASSVLMAEERSPSAQDSVRQEPVD